MASLRDLEKLSKVDIEKTNLISLVNIEEIGIDISMPADQRIMKYFKDVKNPYCFLCGKTPVKITFAENGPELGETIKNFFLRSKC